MNKHKGKANQAFKTFVLSFPTLETTRVGPVKLSDLTADNLINLARIVTKETGWGRISNATALEAILFAGRTWAEPEPLIRLEEGIRHVETDALFRLFHELTAIHQGEIRPALGDGLRTAILVPFEAREPPARAPQTPAAPAETRANTSVLAKVDWGNL